VDEQIDGDMDGSSDVSKLQMQWRWYRGV